MIEINNSKHYINLFNSISELERYVSTRNTKAGRDQDSQEVSSDDWWGTKTFEEATDKLIHGDDELYSSLKTEIDKLNISKILGNISNKQKYVNRTYGCVPNVPAYLQGSPLNMINPEKTALNNKVINIFINIRVSGGTSGSKVTKIGSKYLAVIDILEKAGYRCNVYSGVANSSSTNCLLMVRVKTDKEPLNLKKICFTIASPAMQRRIKFRWMEVNDCRQDYTRCGYGGTCFDDEIKEMLDETKQDYIVWNYERNNVEFKVEDILKELEEQGIKIN